jgi:hypothetical protein
LGLIALLIGSLLPFEGAKAQYAIHVSGTFTDDGVECPAVMGDNGGLYTLIGDVSGFEPGDRVELVGTPVEVSICMQGITLDVQAIQAESVKGQQTLIILEGEILASTVGARNCLILNSKDGKTYGLVQGGLPQDIPAGPAVVIAKQRLTRRRDLRRDLPCGKEVDRTLDFVRIFGASR